MADHEEFDGLCEECHEKEASCTVAMMMGGQVTHRHLCGDCLAKMNATIAAGGVQKILKALMSAVTGPMGEDDEDDENDDTACPDCGTTLSSLKKTGRVGCAACYKAFGAYLEPQLRRHHMGVEHVGRLPVATEEGQRIKVLLADLTRQLKQAVEMEEYEIAAELRDQLQSLAAKGDVS